MRLAEEMKSLAAAIAATPTGGGAGDEARAEAAREAERALRRTSGTPGPTTERGEQAPEPMEAAVATMPASEGEPSWPDESAEAAFLGEARERGEVVVPKKAEDVAEETTAKPLPALDALVERIPAEVRDVLEDLFRAKFVAVKRVPKKALK